MMDNCKDDNSLQTLFEDNSLKIETTDHKVNDISSLNNENNDCLDQMDVKIKPKVRHNSQILSQQLVTNRMDNWKGSPVVNYKTFRKCHQNSSQTFKQEECIRVKKICNNYNISFDENNCNEDIDTEKGVKRKLESEDNIDKKACLSMD
ncbi:uncharacterized protein LOC128962387 [Oppia nitens]|uniref:uncharacterized protein LOC128962387 n=1 Tax=Oppia nitens TaxID=1686743 RepID=UPI0023DA82C3|nr:uncharacterized protein LOC128962387 [Oppia nitens]